MSIIIVIVFPETKEAVFNIITVPNMLPKHIIVEIKAHMRLKNIFTIFTHNVFPFGLFIIDSFFFVIYCYGSFPITLPMQQCYHFRKLLYFRQQGSGRSARLFRILLCLLCC